MSASNIAGAALAVACFFSLWWCLALARRLGLIERTIKTELGQAGEGACRKANEPGGDRAVLASAADAALRSPQVSGAAAPGPQASDCTPEPIDDEVTAKLARPQARQVNRRLAEMARP